MNTRWLRSLMLLLPIVSAAAPTMADELQELRNLRETTIALVNALVQQGVLTREKADELIHQAEQAGKNAVDGASSAVEPGVVRVPYIPQVVREQIRDEVKQEVMDQAQKEHWWQPGALPEWLDRISLLGDTRFRYQADRFPKDSQPNAPPELLQLPPLGYNINNTTEARNRLRLRVRFGAAAKVNDKVDVVIRLTTGSAGTGGDPSTENQNLGNYNSRSTVGFDLAYIGYRPWSWAWFKGGRVGNPFYAPTTMVWGDDLSLEGAVAGVNPRFFDQHFQPFATAGIFPILDVEPTPLTSSHSKWLYGFQVGFNWQLNQIALWRLGAALYDYRHLEGIPNPTPVSTFYNQTAAPFRQKGNTVFDINALANTQNGTNNFLFGLDSRFHEANASTTLDITAFGRTHVVLDAEYVRNLGYNFNEILMRTGQSVSKQNTGNQARLTVGSTSFDVKNSWNAYIGYRHVESDAVVDAFTDSDFHLGGTNATGYYMGARWAFERNTTIGFRWYSAKQIEGPPLAIDVLQVDLVAAF